MILNRERLIEILDNENVQALDNDAEIEDVITLLKSYDDKIQFLKNLKKNRTELIGLEIDRISKKQDILKQVIKNTLTKFEHSSLNFPGIGKVNVRKTPDNWDIKDEEALIDHVSKSLDKEQLEKVLKKTVSISKKEMKTILDQWEKTGELPESVERIVGEKTLSVSFDKTLSEKVKDMEESIQSDTLLEKPEYDGIDF